jgi:gliding motility-associated-like protein
MKKIILLLITSICFFQLNAKINWTPRTSATTSIPAGVPVVITSSYTTSSNAVTVNGNVTSENGFTVTERGIVYGTSAAPTLSNNKIASGAGTGTFSAVTPTLSPGIYFFRAYATNSSGTSYGAELTTTICSPNLPTLLFKLSPPDITTSAIQGQPGIRTENFNTQATGTIPASGTVANGTYTKTGNPGRLVKIEPNAVWGGTESQYLSLQTDAVLNITLTDPSRYLGFWWGDSDEYNRVTMFGSCGGNEIQLGQFTTSSVTNLLAGATVTAVDGNSYSSASYLRANAANQPFAFINLELSDPNVYFTRMEVTQLGGGSFEIDNITSGTVYGAASYTTPSAMTISSITAGGNLTVNFNAPSSNGGQPITNFEYSTNGGTNWAAASPVVTTSPLVISGLSSGTTYSVRIRAVNSIGYGPESVAVNATPIAVAPVITSFTPTSAVTGATVTLTGTDFTGATAVSFGGTAATSFNVVSATSITAVVAAGTSGDVSVTTPGGTAVLAGFTFIPAPVITSFSPASGSVGTLVTIAGTNLETPTAFTIGGTAAIVISNTGTSLVGMVMPGSATGTISLTTASGSATSAATFTLSTTTAPNTQQGAKLVGTGISGSATLGYSVSLSADGTTALVGGYNDNSFRGAAWVFTRSGATWSQQGAKLVATDGGNFTGSNAVKNSRLGFSVSLSADGNTAIVGGYSDNSNKGAAWIFTRSGTTWTQQGAKLVGTEGTSTAYQGHAVSISADGNTAIVGGYLDNANKGAAWIYTRSGATWTQQGNKLVGSGFLSSPNQGRSVSLSADGTTAIVGGWSDDGGKGAAWIFTRSGTTWTQQGAKLVGTGNTGNSNQGYAVSLSADGTTAIVGGLNDNTNKGAAWIFTRSGTTWTQQGNKLVGTGAVNAKQGHSVSISADGNTVIVGGYLDNSNQGAAWIYTRSGTTWSQLGDKLVGTGAIGNAAQGHGVSLSADGTTAMVGGGSDDGSKGAVWIYNYVQPPPPTITSFTPTSAGPTATVTLTGTNFTGATAVSFGGTAATSFTVVSATSITAVIAAGTSGDVSVTTPGGTGVLAGFTFIPDPPAVVCCSDLAGTYAFDVLNNFCGKTYSGSITLTAVAASPGSYNVSDGSFGAWAKCYPDSWANGDVRINDDCGNLTMSGKDKYSVSYSMTVKSVTPTLITFEWRNTYGEFGTVALKSNAGKPWPVPGMIKAASSLTIDAIANQTYTGSALTPAVVVKDGATTLTLGTHYSVTYTNNRNVGTATVTITGKGNYTCTKSQTFSIVIPAPSALSYSTPNVFPKDIAITSLSPTYIGVVTGFSVSPTLPAGLSINATTGVISGIPTTITASNTYVVSASNGTGSITANVLIEIVAGDTDGDGVTDTQEAIDGTDPIDACSYLVGSQTIANTSAAWKAADCDGDGTPNGTDSGPIDYCVGGTGFTIPKLGTAAYNNFFKNGDCDVDGISNHAECNGADNPDDFDGDGIPNYLDTDSDNDMMSDRDERRIDSDGDGDADYLDLDSDNDGILDKLEGNSDADGDGIKNYLDLDSDGDGIKDAWEAAGISEYHQDYNFDGRVSNADGSFPDANGNGLADFLESSMGGKPRGPQDTDKDGIPDYLDLDSDGDSLLDTLEQTYDVDGDGRPNYRDLDSDGDWIADFIDGTMDTDADGTKNFMDLDSDGDGIPDRYEGSAACDNCSGFVDNNNNGWDDRKEMVNPAATDTDGDGTPDFKDTDSDNDGIPDSVEVGKDPSKPVDTDGDGKPDYQDTDSDNDGIPDSVEAGKDPNKPVDTDGDGKPDYLDTDSDNDGIPDSVEAGKDPSKPVDTDGDGKPDYQDTDSDNDGIPDSVEAGKDSNKPVDTDGDGKPDYQDTDSDNDGIPDAVEAGKDPSKPVDTDGDGKPDYQDTDSDNDGIPDSVEAGKDPNKPVDTDGDGKPDYLDTDSDNDGIPDSVEAGKDPSKPVDTDGDGKPDYQDTDSDNDGIPDSVEAGKDPSKPVDTDGDGKPDYLDTDSDNDGIPDSVEAGKDPLIPVDTDKDGIPDYRDLDSDGDGIPDKIEAGKDPSKPVDTDGDGKPDYIDTDSDNDGIPDAVEAGNVNNPVDTDGDGKPDYQDTDSDNDGIPDKIEAGVDPTKPVDTDADGTPDYRDLDSDNDGYADKEEAGKDPSNPVDTDKDGKPDYQDTDSDNDGILDKLENDINYGALADCDKDGVDNRIDADQCPTFAPNGISPNGDGKNDVLITPGILRNQPNELTIFNRWGNIVYQTSNYKNDWGGQTDRAFSLLAGDNLLPDGTYYYVIDFFGKYPNVGTYVYINRQEK